MGFGAIDAAPLELDSSERPRFYKYCAPLELAAPLRCTNPPIVSATRPFTNRRSEVTKLCWRKWLDCKWLRRVLTKMGRENGGEGLEIFWR
jgi:hypothetical protein